MEKDNKTICDLCGEEVTFDMPSTSKDGKTFHLKNSDGKKCWWLYFTGKDIPTRE